MLHKDLTGSILDSCFKISNKLGIGFIESVYHESLLVELARKNIGVKSKIPIDVTYEEVIVGKFEPDLLVEDKVIVEIKAVDNLARPHFAQAINYLRITNLDLAIVVNFGTSKIQYRRFNNRFKDGIASNLRELMNPDKTQDV